VRSFVPWLLSALLLLVGCVEAEESWDLAADGAGTWTLRVTWDADLARRLVDLVGSETVRALEGPSPLPLDAAAWRDALADLDGVTVGRIAVDDEEDGRRTLHVEAAFQRLEALLGCELLKGRAWDLALVTPEGDVREAPRAASGDVARLALRPFEGAGLLRGLAEVRADLAAGGATPGERAAGDPSVLERLGVDPSRAALVETILKPHLPRVHLAVVVRVSGALEEVGEEPVEGGREARFVLGLDDLMRDSRRLVRLAWRPRLFDRVPRVDEAGAAVDVR
jgi:hypothetical protein